MPGNPRILCIIGPTASGKSSRGVREALVRHGEIISVDSRQVYRGLDIGTEKITREEMQGVPHHLIDICDAREPYSAGDFVQDASRLIAEIAGRGALPILVGGTHFYFDALLSGLPAAPVNPALRDALQATESEELLARIRARDPRRAAGLDPKNRRRLIRALEILETHEAVPLRKEAREPKYAVEWIELNPPKEELGKKIDARLAEAFDRGLIEEVGRVRHEVGDARLDELGLEYRVVGEYLRGERTRESLLPALSAKLRQLARRQRAWVRKLTAEPSRSDRS